MFFTADTCILFKCSQGAIYLLAVSGDNYILQDKFWKADTITSGQTLLFRLKTRFRILEEVIVKDTRGMITKADTLIIGVDSIKTKPHASAAELLDRIPGVDLNGDGSVNVLGKRVSTITVDGKEIFGGNPKATLEAVRADMIRNLAVADVNDGSGNGGKSLDIRLKSGKKRGIYGETAFTAGTDGRIAGGVKANGISPASFCNFFANYNNINKGALSDQDYLQLVNFNGFTSSSTLVTQKLYYDFKLDDPFSSLNSILSTNFFDRGVRSSFSSGGSINKTMDKLSFSSYFITSSEHTLQSKNDYDIRFLNPSTEYDQSVIAYNLEDFHLLNESSLKWAPDEKDRIQGKLTLQHQASTDHPSTATQSMLKDSNNVVQQNTGVVNMLINHVVSDMLFARGSWEHRYEKPAQKTALTAGVLLKSNNGNDIYQNSLNQVGITILSNNNSVLDNGHDRTVYAEVQHSTPLNRIFLIDFHIGAMNDNYTDRANGFNYNPQTGGYTTYSPAISNGLLTVNNSQATAQALLLYKSGGLTASVSTGILRSDWETKSNGNTVLTVDKNYFLPNFYFAYTFHRYHLTFTHTREVDLPGYRDLAQALDSSNIQQVLQGNSTLRPYLKKNYVFSADVNYPQIGNISSAINYQRSLDPVVTSSTFGQGLYPIQSYAQFGVTSQLSANIAWFKFDQLKKVNFFAFIFYLHQQEIQLSANEVFPLSFYSITSNFGMKWSQTGENQINISLRPVISGTANGSTSSGDFRQLFLELKNDNKLTSGFYYSLTTKWMIADDFGTSYTIRPITGLAIYKYLLEGQSLQFNAAVANLFNVTNIQDMKITPILQSRSNISYLKRYVSLGLVFYPEKWTK